MKKLKVLIGCEFSGTVRDAFAALGHDAWSCDTLPSETPGNHYQCDVREVLNKGWDLGVFHPPCTFLCNSGVRWLSPKGVINKDRHAKMMEACDLFATLFACDIPHVAVENPIMHKYARNYLEKTWRVTRHNAKPSQIIHPFQFGHGERKATCLWLRGLPLLVPTNHVAGREQRIWKMPPSADRWKERSRTFPGIAAAMASQWSEYLTSNPKPV